jgi:uncharacterized protein YbjT (DUF2867 family)
MPRIDKSPIAVVAGATGAVGSQLLSLLLARDDGTRVLTVGRRAPAISSPRLEHVSASLETLGAALAGRQCTEAFCCLGTTMKSAGTRAAFRAVDLDGAVAFARGARGAGARFFGLVSAAGASSQSRNFYLRTKGETEAMIEELGFPSLAILQPGLLRGSRAESRPIERLGQVAAPLLDRLLIGKLAPYRSVAIGSVAAALDVAARAQRPGVHRLDSAAIGALSHGRQ